MDPCILNDEPGRKLSKSSGRSSMQYLRAVQHHSGRSKELFLYPGLNYRFLSQFLEKSLTSSLGPKPRDNDDHILVYVHTFKPNGGTSTLRYANTDIDRFSSQQAKSDPADGSLVFLSGFATPEWLIELGAVHNVDHELWRRHLDFMKPKDYFDLPGLLSSSNRMFELKIMTICTRSAALNRSQVLAARKTEAEDVAKYQKKLGLEESVGESIVRKFSVHNETTFTIEQNISCLIKPKKSSSSGWTAIVWLDSGRRLDNGPPGPWLSNEVSGTSSNVFHPIHQYRPKVALKKQDNDHMLRPPRSEAGEQVNRSISSTDAVAQSASILPRYYGATLNASLASSDSNYALTELFIFAAHSECQFLNLMSSQIEQEMNTFEDHMMHSLQNLQYSKALIDEHIAYLARVVAVLKMMRAVASCKANISNVSTQAVNDSILQDYEQLAERARDLRSRCLDGAGDITSKAKLDKSEEAILENQRISRISLLAFIFLPLNLGTGIFGMNFKQLGQGDLSLWVGAPVFATLMIVSVVLVFPHILSRLIPGHSKT